MDIQQWSIKMGKVIQFPKRTEDGRTPLFVSHIDGTVKGSSHFNRPTNENFGDRISRIRTSLDRINKLMAELRKQQGANR